MNRATVSKKRDIVFLTHDYHSLGGVQRSTTTIANALYSRGHEVRIISISPGEVPMSLKLNPRIRVTTCNSRVHSRQKAANSVVGRKLQKPLARIFRYWKPRSLQFPTPQKQGVETLVRELEVHNEETIIVVTNVMAMHYLNFALRKRTLPRPKIIGQHKGDSSVLTASNMKRLVTTYASADLLLGLTEEDSELLSKFASTPVSHIPNPIPSPPPRYLQEPKDKRFVALGRLSSQKGYDRAIHAWAPVARKFPEWELVIYGEGPLRRELERLVSRLGLEENVSLPGKTDNPSLVLARSRANIVTSPHEGFGLTISEAAAVGTPTVAFDTSPGVRLQIRHEENGLLVPLDAISQLSEAITRIIIDEQLYDRLRMNCLSYVDRFGVVKTMQRWEDIFARLFS